MNKTTQALLVIEDVAAPPVVGVTSSVQEEVDPDDSVEKTCPSAAPDPESEISPNALPLSSPGTLPDNE